MQFVSQNSMHVIPPLHIYSSSKCDFEKSFIQDYFTSNYFYFKKILGKRLGERKSLIDSDMPILKEAYDKSHQKVQFEIDLHWKRTNHIWTLVLALVVSTGALISLYLTSAQDKRQFIIHIITIFSLICMTVTKISLSMLRVSSMWCRNWELHLVMLEPLFSGRLYQTHLGIGSSRFSMSKLNNLFLWVAFFSWVLLFEISIFATSQSILQFLCTLILIVVLIQLISFVVSFFLKTKNEPSIPYEITQYGIRIIPEALVLKKIKNSLKDGASIFVAFLIVVAFVLFSAYIFMMYSPGFEHFEFESNDFFLFLNSNTSLYMPFFK